MNTTKYLIAVAAAGWMAFIASEAGHKIERDVASDKVHQAALAETLAKPPVSFHTTDTALSSGAAGNGSFELVRAKAQVTALQQQYSALKDQLRSVEKMMVAAGAPKPYEFEVSQAEWKDLAEEGHIKYRAPCWNPQWSLSDKETNELGLSPDDQKEVMDAYKRSGERMWQMAKTLCGSFMDREDAIWALGPERCISMAETIAMKKGLVEPAATAKKLVAETKAGLQPAPNSDPWIQRLAVAYTMLTDEGDAFQKDLEQSFGPAEAAHIWHEFPCARTEQ